jgi:hypothetical protein
MSLSVAQRAAAGPSYRVNPYRRTKVPSAFELHLMNRLGCGYSRATWAQMRRAGGATQWFEKQLRPAGIEENRLASSLDGWFPGFDDSLRRRWQRHTANDKGAWEYARELGNLAMLRRMYTNRQLQETMVDFWSNHMHVKANGDLAWIHRYEYDQTIRRHALGRFDELLTATSLHPAMLLYLNNWQSVRDAPNENQGRELLELHTVGRTSGYTEQMVKDSAKILSGWTVDAYDSWRGLYDPDRHTTGPVQVLGFKADNASADGRQLARDYLHYLAHHPATARTIARKLAIRFVSDTPSDDLVNHLASVFRRSGTSIKATLRALVAHPEFRRSSGAKVRTPIEDMIASVRSLQVVSQRPRTRQDSFADRISWVHQSMFLYHWPRPDGPPETNPAWASATRMLTSFKMHWNMAVGYWPSVDVTYKKPHYWLPQRRIRFDAYVDHLCRMWLGHGSTSRLLAAACQATDTRPGEVITRQHPIAGWLFVRLAAALLDTPEHMTR